MILADSNVVIATLAAGHPHQSDSEAFLLARPREILIAAHSLSEAYSALTRKNLPYKLDGETAVAALDRLISRLRIVALTAAQTVDAIRQFSAVGTGPRLYDYLIGATGQAHGAHTIATWDISDFRPLFPRLLVATPAELAS